MTPFNTRLAQVAKEVEPKTDLPAELKVEC
jgi:hypothetical protein